MRSLFFYILVMFLISACTQGSNPNTISSSKVKQPSPLNSSPAKEDSTKKSKACNSGGADCSQENSAPAARYSWDTKMVLW